MAHTTGMAHFAKTTTLPPLLTTSQQPDLESLSCAARVTLAIQAMKSDALLSQRRAATMYNMPETTL
jgi:hypothetical protein